MCVDEGRVWYGGKCFLKKQVSFLTDCYGVRREWGRGGGG